MLPRNAISPARICAYAWVCVCGRYRCTWKLNIIQCSQFPTICEHPKDKQPKLPSKPSSLQQHHCQCGCAPYVSREDFSAPNEVRIPLMVCTYLHATSTYMFYRSSLICSYIVNAKWRTKYTNFSICYLFRTEGGYMELRFSLTFMSIRLFPCIHHAICEHTIVIYVYKLIKSICLRSIRHQLRICSMICNRIAGREGEIDFKRLHLQH